MGKKSRRAVYDPSIMDRVDDIQPLDPDPLAFGEADLSMPEDSYETQETEILDPKLHRTGPSKNRTRFWCLTALVSAGLIAIIVTTSVILAKNNQKSQANSAAAGADGIIPVRNIPPAPVDLEPSCIDGFNNRKKDPTGYQACVQACQVAECCDLPSNFELSCLKNNEETCLDYHQACHVLSLPDSIDQVQTSTVVVPNAPPNLPQLCALHNLTTNEGIRQCAMACLPYECCYETGVVNCQDANPNTCDTYAPCLNLRAIDEMNQGMAYEVVKSCEPNYAATLQGRLDCRKTCKLAQCCFTGNKECGDERDGDFCKVQYKPCSILYDGSLPDLQTGDDDTLPGNGNDDDYYYDDAYYDDDGDGDDGIDGADDAAIDDQVVFGEDQEYDDQVEHPTLEAPPDDLASRCDTDYIAGDTTKIEYCRGICKQAQCCLFEAQLPQSCLLGNNLKCMEYQRHCAAVFGNPDEATTGVNKAPDDIAQTCSPVSLATSNGMAQCQAACEPAQCCYDWNVASCGTDTDCASYAPCLNLQTMSQAHDSVEEVVDKLCTAEEVVKPKNRVACESVCMQHSCCWAYDGSPCPDDVQPSCKYYDGCKYLQYNISGDPNISYVSLETPPKNLKALCSQSDVSECEAWCAKAECCDIPQNLPGSCLKGHHTPCLHYHLGCSVLEIGEGVTTTVTVDPAPPDLVPFCSVESLATEYGRKRCTDLCTPAECCWSMDIGEGQSCRDQSACIDYSPCMALRAGYSTDASIGTDVSETCADNLLVTAEGLASCQQVCLQHTCCWDVYDDDVGMCWDDPSCVLYESCSNLLSYMEDDDTGGDRTRKDRRGLLRQ